jgi:hypothetical protein
MNQSDIYFTLVTQNSVLGFESVPVHGLLVLQFPGQNC